MPNTFYPSISRLITKETASGNLGMFHDALDQVFDHTFYRDLQTDKSKHGDYAFFWLKVILYKKLGFEIPGTNGLELLLNPSDTVTNGTEIPHGLPPFWTKTPNQSIDITGKNLLIGTGGFSGTIGLDGNGVRCRTLTRQTVWKCLLPIEHPKKHISKKNKIFCGFKAT